MNYKRRNTKLQRKPTPKKAVQLSSSVSISYTRKGHDGPVKRDDVNVEPVFVQG